MLPGIEVFVVVVVVGDETTRFRVILRTLGHEVYRIDSNVYDDTQR